MENGKYEGKNILIIGPPCSGKTHLSEELKKVYKKHFFIHTDDFIQYGFVDSLYKLIQYLRDIKKPTIIEGVLGYRLLRKGLELDCYTPDIIIECKADKNILKERYEQRGRDFDKLKPFIKQTNNILAEYIESCDNLPKWEFHNN